LNVFSIFSHDGFSVPDTRGSVKEGKEKTHEGNPPQGELPIEQRLRPDYNKACAGTAAFP
jgi:hypothetical protein